MPEVEPIIVVESVVEIIMPSVVESVVEIIMPSVVESIVEIIMPSVVESYYIHQHNSTWIYLKLMYLYACSSEKQSDIDWCNMYFTLT